MSTINLEKTPEAFVSPYLNNKICYRMVHFNKWEYNVICDIDLKRDKLVIHGTEIKEPVLQKLHDSLRLGPSAGKIYVNCNGACYIWVSEGGFYRPLHNVIFDWSPFGVIVPNSVNDTLSKQLQQKDKELVELSANKDSSLEALKKKIEELKEQLSASLKDREDMKMELKKVCNQLSTKEFELESMKIEFESSKGEVNELKDQVSAYKNDNQNKERAFKMVQDQLSSTISELKSMLENYKERIMELEEELSFCKSELQFTMRQLGSSNNVVAQLLEQLKSYETESRAKEAELQKVQHQLSMLLNDQVQSMKIVMEFTEAKAGEDQAGRECYVNKAIEIVDE